MSVKHVTGTIKPDNILLSASLSLQFILADFNTAIESSSTESASTQFSSPVGTNGYIAAEVSRPGEKTSVKMDIFSLGCVFYYTLTDKCHPFGSVEHLKKCQGNINHGQEPSLDVFLKCAWSKPIIREMLSFHPKQRPSGKRVLEALEVRELVQVAVQNLSTVQCHQSFWGVSQREMALQPPPLHLGFCKARAGTNQNLKTQTKIQERGLGKSLPRSREGHYSRYTWSISNSRKRLQSNVLLPLWMKQEEEFLYCPYCSVS